MSATTLLWVSLALAQEAEQDTVPPAPDPAPAPTPAPDVPPAPDPAPAPAPDPAASALEAEMFGAPAVAPVEPEAPASGAPLPETGLSGERDEAALLGARTSNSQIGDLLDTADEALTLGGKLTLRNAVALPEDGAFSDMTLSSPNLLDVFLDARPDDRTRAFIQARLSHDWTVASGDTDPFGNELSESKVTLDQLWLKFDVARKVFVTAGRQRVKWGTGRFWNPTDILNQQALDPLAIFDTRTGVSLLRVHVPVSRYANLYAVGNLEGADTLAQVGGAARAEVVLGQTEASVSVGARKDQPLRLGADLSSGVWIFDLRLEAALQHGVTEPFWEGTLDLDTFTFPTEVSREEDWIPQVVAGAEVSFRLGDEDTLSLGAEYFWNDAGYEDPNLYAWLLLNGQYTPFYLGRQYGGVYAFLPAPGRLDDHSFTLSALANLSDQTGLVRAQHSWSALSWLDITSYASLYLGDQGEFHYALTVPAVAGVEGLEDGYAIVPTTLELGLWASVRF